MDQEILNSYSKLNDLNVSRETFLEFENYISMIIEKNKEINIISQENAKNDVSRERHIIDSAQLIDFIDFNQNTTTDLGSGGGMPGIVIAIILKNMKKNIKMYLYEKSHHKSLFLKDVSRKLQLKSTKSMICAESIIWRSIIDFFDDVFWLIMLIFSFFSIIIDI